MVSQIVSGVLIADTVKLQTTLAPNLLSLSTAVRSHELHALATESNLRTPTIHPQTKPPPAISEQAKQILRSR